MYLKRLLAFLCCFTLVFCLFPSSAFATGGNGNIDGGGGGMGQGTSSNFWTPGNDGVRITVVDASSGTAVSSPLDFSNRTQKTSLLHFGKVNKLQYLSGTGLSLQSGAAYSCIKPAQSMPTIVSSKGQSNIEAMALVRGPWQVWLLLGVFTLWGLWVVLILLLPYMQQAKRHRQRQQRTRQLHAEGIQTRSFEIPDLGSTSSDDLLVCHTNHRILAYLHSAYPQATFEWCEKQPEQLIRNGGTGRIRVFGIDEFDHADVTLDQNANIKCDMVKIVPLSKVGGETNENDTTPPNRQPVDPRIWYETQGRSVLEALISDLNSRGHSKLTLREDGDICIEQGEDAVSQEHLNNFPQKVYWPRLAEVLESNGLAAEVTAQGIQVSW